MHWQGKFSVGVLMLALGAAPSGAAIPRESVLPLNRVSKPAGGSVDELKARLDTRAPIKPQLAPIDDPNLHADQCRAVLGPLPEVNCHEGFLMPLHHDGKLVTYEGGELAQDGVPADRSILTDCDDPALLPFLFGMPKPRHRKGDGAKKTVGCTPNTRMGHIRSGTVDWVYDCHFAPASGLHEPDAPFDFVAVIGSNRETGETCFFAHDNFPVTAKTAPVPGGKDPKDPEQRRVAAQFWNRPADNTCFRCHANNKPWALSPHMNQSRVGGDGTMDFLPETPLAKRLLPNWGYRLVGTVHNFVMPQPKLIWPKNDDGTVDHTCLKCHLVVGSMEYLRLARTAVGLADVPEFLPISSKMPHYKAAWMPNGVGEAPALAKYQAAVTRIERAVRDPKFRAKQMPSVSPCPPPGRIEASAVKVVRGEVAWTYRNDYGHVASRDDIRFEVRLQGTDGTDLIVKDIAPEALGSDQWRFRHPVETGVTYTYRLKPYRYCFTQLAYRESNEVNVTSPAR